MKSLKIKNILLCAFAATTLLSSCSDFLDKLPENSKHSKKCTFYTLRFGCSFAVANTIKPQLL